MRPEQSYRKSRVGTISRRSIDEPLAGLREGIGRHVNARFSADVQAAASVWHHVAQELRENPDPPLPTI
jgi:hypothetical protein